ncbi:hypothetical protein PHSY_001928 [Pseudozyma hubeiensis SY62]|uniref:Uncharacterized protein n=1 Tax=Pseudozyma hubeiensis (strain SY62) TaxID=1305764 RepID=R9P048_PSEHS|nr:hypothetical protein PHSY_001928 [Pseudozyma hubeiensis SY62]GAC94357.1 hypothetical protein PHSY_001928 [Pseudozyma hubeiensis SY62]
MSKLLPPNPPTVEGKPLFIAPNGPKPNRRVMIANRGEIALRIVRTCQQMNVETVVVYTEVDASAEFVAHATVAVNVGAMTTDDNPYLNITKLIDVALQHRCDALHPGYGYLSENADFADAVAATGSITFLGPRGDVMRSIGEKSRSKQLLHEKLGADAHLVPGYHGTDEIDLETAQNIGYPLMIKASSGGGGRGMRIVRSPDQLAPEIARARSEALRNFGSAELLFERYIEGGKHIEVQIFGDNHGNVYALGERDCSVQRRHQKIIEESPSTDCEADAELRKRIHQSAITIGSLLSYQGAGTVEYIYDTKTKEFFFLEVNTRLQVEHPVTEMCSGLDLVSLGVYVGGDGDLSKLEPVAKLKPFGHSIECRVCAEEPGADFTPRTGVVRMLEVLCLGQPGVRFDTSIRVGTTVSIFFDAMLGKLIVHAATRAAAIEKMLQVLQTSVVIGLPTNTTFMSSCLRHPSFVDGSYNTSLIPNNLEWLLDLPVQLAPSALSTGPKQGALPLATIVPAFHLFKELRGKLYPSRSGLPANFDLVNGCDRSVSKTENFVVSLPDGGQQWDVMVEYDGSHGEYELKMWINESSQAAQAAEERIKDKLGSKAKPKVLAAQLKAARASTKFYGSLPTRNGLEGRAQGEWQLGVQSSEVHCLRSKLLTSSQVQLSSLPATTRSHLATGRARWATATLALEIDGITSTHILATDHSFQDHENGAQTAWVWSSQLCGPIKVVRHGMRTYALANQSLDDSAASKSAYVTPMPAKILKILVENQATVEPGQALLICESMKIETTIRAQVAGKLQLHVQNGDTVPEGKLLCQVGGGEEQQQQQQ